MLKGKLLWGPVRVGGSCNELDACQFLIVTSSAYLSDINMYSTLYVGADNVPQIKREHLGV